MREKKTKKTWRVGCPFALLVWFGTCDFKVWRKSQPWSTLLKFGPKGKDSSKCGESAHSVYNLIIYGPWGRVHTKSTLSTR